MSEPVAVWSEEQVRAEADRWETRSAPDLLAWAVATFHPALVLACSFGAEDVVLVEMLARIRPDARAFYLDTGFLFPETIAVRDRLAARHPQMTFAAATPRLTPEEQAAAYGEHLYWREPDACCRMRKVEPLTKVLGREQAWITGIRRDQSPTRATARVLEWDAKFGLVKLNPLAAWTWDQVWDYIRRHDVPYNPLHDQNYPSIGCMPCTRPVQPGDDPRAGRWAGFAKTECGLHK